MISHLRNHHLVFLLARHQKITKSHKCDAVGQEDEGYTVYPYPL